MHISFGNIIVRPFQLFFVAVVLGLSIELIKEQYKYSVPAVTNFALACGVFGAVAMFTGLAAVFVSALQGVVMLVLDGLSTLLFFAGAIALATQLGAHSCTSRPAGWNQRAKSVDSFKPPNPYCASNPIIAGGATDFGHKGTDAEFFFYHKPNSWFVSRCRMAQALDAFMFFAFFAFAASLVVDAISMKRNRSRGTKTHPDWVGHGQ